MESHSKHGEMIYARAADGFYVNLFIASEARWKRTGPDRPPANAFPQRASDNLTLQLDSPRQLALRVRWPAWVSSGQFQVSLNGRKIEVQGAPGQYITLKRLWHSGDRVQIELLMQPRVEALPHSQDYAAFSLARFSWPPLGTKGLHQPIS